MIKITDLAILTVVLCVFYYLLNQDKKEHLDAVVVTNAFSDLRCISDDLPIVRLIDNKSVQCLSKSESDTENCMMRSDFSINSNIKCNDINTHLVKQIRDKNSPVTKVYNNLESNTNYNLLTCNPEAMNDSSHWCGKIYNVVKNDKCNSNEGKYGLWVNPCKQMPEYAASTPKGSKTLIVNKSQILQAKAEAKLVSDISRNKGLCGSIKDCNNELTTGGGRGAVTCRFKNEGDGNIAMYDNANKKVWESGTSGKGSAPYKVVLRPDGNFVLLDKDNNLIWESKSQSTSSSRLNRANLLEKGGSCVLEITDKDNNLIWSTQKV